MKKILFIFLCLLLIGCGKNNKDVFNEIEKKNNSLNSYSLKGELSMYNGDNKYTYNVDVKYKKDSSYRVSLINTVNNHEQIILRNDDGVFVLTPSLNKSFKFQSDWPYNNSQVYILDRLVNDIDEDDERKYENKDDLHIFTSKVVYSTNSDLVKQKVYFDSSYLLKKVEVLNNKDEITMEFNVTSFDENSNIDEKIFKLDNNIDTNKSDNEEKSDATVSNTIKDIIYPMYLPNNTYLTSQNKVDKDNGERVILSFGGDKSFTLIEETISVGKEMDINLTYGEPDLIIDTVGSINDYEINWVSGNIEYSLVSDSLDKNELVSVAKSITSNSITK